MTPKLPAFEVNCIPMNLACNRLKVDLRELSFPVQDALGWVMLLKIAGLEEPNAIDVQK